MPPRPPRRDRATPQRGRSCAALARRVGAILAVWLLAPALPACHSPEPEPVTREVIHLHGDGYQRGLQHGQRLRHRIRAFYTRLLTVALFPNLGREQPPIAEFLQRYQGPTYQNGNFSYQVLLEMAETVEAELPADVREEIRGIADGCGLTYDQVLVLNTFADTTLAVRAIAATLKLSRGPRLQSIQFLGQLDAAGAQTKPIAYLPLPHALTSAVPTGATLRLVLHDPEGVDETTVRVVMGDRVFEPGSAGFATAELGEGRLQVTLTPPTPLPAAQAVSLVVVAGDRTVAADPPPAHARFGRDEGLTFTTVGDERPPTAVANVAPDDGRSRPPPVALAVRGAASADGELRLAQHFALIDAGASSDATVVLVHHPPQGPTWATVGWAGIAWGLAGVADSGLSWGCNFADTLDNAVVKDLLPQVGDLPAAKLTARGWPIGFAMRHALAQATTVSGAIAALRPLQHLNGWSCVLGDAAGDMAVVELDANARLLHAKTGDGVHVVPEVGVGPGPASASADDARLSVHYVANVQDVDPAIAAVATALLEPTGLPVRIDQQALVSTYWLKSLRTFGQLGERLAQGRGAWDVPKLQTLLAEPRFVDRSDSMFAVVIEPKARRLHHAMGALPATAADWQSLTLSPEKP